MAFGFQIPPIHIDAITYAFEGIKRDTNRLKKIESRDSIKKIKGIEEGFQIVIEEIEIFEKE